VRCRPDARDSPPKAPSVVMAPYMQWTSQRFVAAVTATIRAEGNGVPAHRISLRSATEFQDNFMLSHEYLPRDAWRHWHPCRRFAEDLEAVRDRPDVEAITSPVVAHVPIMWFDSQQVQRARSVGANFQVAQGPSQFGGLPKTRFKDTYVSPSYWCAQKAWYRAMHEEFLRVERGYKFRISRIPGGRNGLRTPAEATRPEWRRVIARNVDGWAVAERPMLPDPFTDMSVEALYREAVKEDISDLGIISEHSLYGLRSQCTASSASHHAPNYKPALKPLIYTHLKKERQKKLTEFAKPRLLCERLEPSTNPERDNPKSGVEQVKAGGKIKVRGTTDAGFQRRRRFKASDGQWYLEDEAPAVALVAAGTGAHAELQSSKKGANGVDSINENIPDGDVGFEYGSVRRFGQQVDVLVSSGVAVDLWFEDMASWYEQFAVANTDQWFCTQMVSPFAETDPRGCFGYKHYPEQTNRFNHALEEMISKRQRRAQEQLLQHGPWTPWSAEMRTRTVDFVQMRRAKGFSGDLVAKNAWFDDNQGAALRPFAATARKIQLDFWVEFKIAFSAEKSKYNPWETTVFEAAVGVEIRARMRLCTLPPEKVDRYCSEIEEMLQTARQSRKRLAPREQVERILGRAVHACEPIPMVWTVLVSLIPQISSQASFRHWIQIHESMEPLFTEMVELMRHRNGRPLTAREPRPGADGYPVIVGASDASRREGSFFGAAGGWFRFWGSQTVFFFSRQWAPEVVEAHNISELEMVGANMLAHLADKVATATVAQESMYYLYQFGDNESVFRHCLNGFHAGTTGMRRLLAQRARADYQCNRMAVAAHVFREENKASDALANLDEETFVAEIRQQLPRAQFVRLHVPADIAALP
jgi:hypothetical protein